MLLEGKGTKVISMSLFTLDAKRASDDAVGWLVGRPDGAFERVPGWTRQGPLGSPAPLPLHERPASQAPSIRIHINHETDHHQASRKGDVVSGSSKGCRESMVGHLVAPDRRRYYHPNNDE